MTTIRPNLPPTPAPHAQGLDSARHAAQRAFFAAAMGQASPAPAAIEPAPAQPVQTARAAEPAEAPTRILRPGSLVDIRV